MLTLPEKLLADIYAHGEETFPAECCGLMIGTSDGTNREVVELVRASNPAAEQRNDRREFPVHNKSNLARRPLNS